MYIYIERESVCVNHTLRIPFENLLVLIFIRPTIKYVYEPCWCFVIVPLVGSARFGALAPYLGSFEVWALGSYGVTGYMMVA